MPGLPGPHQKGRRRGFPRCRAEGRWFGMGRQEEDAVSGWKFPVRLMVEQRGRKVSPLYRDGSLDLPEEW